MTSLNPTDTTTWSDSLADHLRITAHPDEPLICLSVRNAEVTMTPAEWAKVSVAGDLAALRIRARQTSATP